MAISVVEKVVEETGVPVDVEVIDVNTLAQARKQRVAGSPTVRVDGRDVDPWPNGHGEDDFSPADRVYRTERGLAAWPDAQWVRDALLRAVAQTTTNGNH